MSGIPIIDLSVIQKRLGSGNADQKYLIHKFSSGNMPLWEPCRMEVYFIAFLQKGEVFIEADLMQQRITAPAIFAMAPSIIRKFIAASENFSSEVVFFEKAFIQQNLSDQTYLDNYFFFGNSGNHLIPITDSYKGDFLTYFNLLRKQKSEVRLYLDDVVRNIIQILLAEIASTNLTARVTKKYTYLENHAAIFKENLEHHFRQHRLLSFYADLQHLTGKYLSQVIRTVHGKSAGEMIDERIILEARALLNNKKLTISQISSQLGFTDPSNFGKYFKHLTDQSPLSYRRGI